MNRDHSRRGIIRLEFLWGVLIALVLFGVVNLGVDNLRGTLLASKDSSANHAWMQSDVQRLAASPNLNPIVYDMGGVLFQIHTGKVNARGPMEGERILRGLQNQPYDHYVRRSLGDGKESSLIVAEDNFGYLALHSGSRSPWQLNRHRTAHWVAQQASVR